MSRRRREIAPTPTWCSADFPKAPPSRDSSPRMSYRMERPTAHRTRCHPTSQTMSPRSPCSGSPTNASCGRSVNPTSRLARCTRPKPSTYAFPTISFVRTGGTSTLTCNTWTREWSTRRRRMPPLSSRQDPLLPRRRRRLLRPRRGNRLSLPHRRRRLHLSHHRQLLLHRQMRLPRRRMTHSDRFRRERCCCVRPRVRWSDAVDSTLTSAAGPWRASPNPNPSSSGQRARLAERLWACRRAVSWHRRACVEGGCVFRLRRDSEAGARARTRMRERRCGDRGSSDRGLPVGLACMEGSRPGRRPAAHPRP